MVGKQSRTSSATQSAYSPPVLIGRKPALGPALKASCQKLSASQLDFIPRAFSGMRW